MVIICFSPPGPDHETQSVSVFQSFMYVGLSENDDKAPMVDFEWWIFDDTFRNKSPFDGSHACFFGNVWVKIL
jgi:hypothetical protein